MSGECVYLSYLAVLVVLDLTDMSVCLGVYRVS